MSFASFIFDGYPKSLGQMIKYPEFIRAINNFKSTKDEKYLVKFTPYLLISSMQSLRIWIFYQNLVWKENQSDQFTISPPWVADEGIMLLTELKETVKYKEACASYREFPLAGIYDFDKFQNNLNKQDWQTLRTYIFYYKL
jgi:hypothetical protein